MKICYIDEAGCCGSLPNATSDIQPSLAIAGLIVDYGRLHATTLRLLDLKQRFFPGQISNGTTRLGRILFEIKGSDLRKGAVAGGRNHRRQTLGFLDGMMTLCEEANARLIGRVWVKGIGSNFDGRAVYTSSIQAIATYFQRYLTEHDDIGFMVADSRLKLLNSQVAHSIFTQKFKGGGDSYDRIIELPCFAHSDNHAGLQIIDCLCSGIVTPIVMHTYCRGHIQSVHVRPGYNVVKDRYSGRLNRLQYRYQEASGRWQGGLTVSDDIGGRPGGLMFRQDNAPHQIPEAIYVGD